MLAITAFCSRPGGPRATSRRAKSLGLGTSFRLLTAVEERALATRVRAGDRAARDELVVRNMPLAIRMATHFECSGMTLDDLVQEGFCGLIQAAEKFDPQTHGTRFASYAVYWIIQAIQRALGSNSSLVRVPHYLWSLQHRLNKALVRQRNLEYETGQAGPEDPDSIAAALGISRSRQELLHKARLEQRPHQMGDDESVPLEDQVVDPFSGVDEVEKAEQIQALHQALETLPPVEAWVIRRRFRVPENLGEEPDDTPRSADALAAELGVSRKRILDLERSALKRLRRILDGGPRLPRSRG